MVTYSSQTKRFVLNFHGLGKPSVRVPSEEKPYWVDVSVFIAILDMVQGREDVLVTFDDGNESDFEFALPSLKARKMTAKFFVSVGQLDKKEFLSLKQLGLLADSGMTIGSHGVRHCAWTDLSDANLRTER